MLSRVERDERVGDEEGDEGAARAPAPASTTLFFEADMSMWTRRARSGRTTERARECGRAKASGRMEPAAFERGGQTTRRADERAREVRLSLQGEPPLEGERRR